MKKTSRYIILALLITALVIARLIFNAPTNYYAANAATISEAKNIAHAMFIYKTQTGSIFNLKLENWALSLKNDLDLPYQSKVVGPSNILDPFDEEYDFSQDGNNINIFSYNMGPIIQVNLNTGQTRYVSMNTWQSLKQIFFKILL